MAERDDDYGGSSPIDAVSRGGYQRTGEEGRRYFDPGSPRARAGQTGQRGMADEAGEEVAAPFDEDRIIERVDQDHRGRGPKGGRRSDARLAEEVNDRLLDAPDVDATDIEVAVRDAEVALTGTVATRAERRRAEELAEDVRGILFVANRLRVAGSARPGEGAPGYRGGTAEPILPTGAGSDASATSDSRVTGMAAGTGTAAGGDPLLGAEETQGRRYAKAPVDGSG